MAATGKTPIQLYRTTTAAAVPAAGNLAAGELAINTTDEKLYFKNASGAVTLLASSASASNVGTVTSVSGTGTVNGISLTGTVTSSGSITLGGSLSGVSLTTQVTGTLPVANGGTGVTASTGSGNVVLSTSPTITNTTLAGTSALIAATLTNAAEVTTISATAATGTINYDVGTQAVLYYTSNASADWTPNFRMSSGTSLNTAMSTGQSITVAFLVTQGATAYKSTAVQVDGNAITPKWQGGSAPTAGNASSIDIYTYTIVKTGSAAFTVFASQTQFK